MVPSLPVSSLGKNSATCHIVAWFFHWNFDMFDELLLLSVACQIYFCNIKIIRQLVFLIFILKFCGLMTIFLLNICHLLW